jgi:hypothetical protein
VQGRFIKSKSDAHFQLREELLHKSVSHKPETEFPVLDPLDNDTIGIFQESLRDGNGICTFTFSREPSNSELIAISQQLGNPLPERSNDVAEFVEDVFILNIVNRFDCSAPMEMQPFSNAALTLHTESSGNPLSMQPRYIMFYCAKADIRGDDAATLIVPMPRVAEKLSDETLSLLAKTRYLRCEQGPHIVRATSHGPAFSFRDFGASALDQPGYHRLDRSAILLRQYLCRHACRPLDRLRGPLPRRGFQRWIPDPAGTR